MAMSVPLLINAKTILLISICLFTDLKINKISNKVTYPCFVVGVALNLFGMSGDPLRGLKGGCLALCLFGALYAFHCVAAGDVKLMSAIGALQGPTVLISAGFHILAVAAVFGLVTLIWKENFLSLIRGAGISALSLITPGAPVIPLPKQRTLIPFAPAVFLGTLLAMFCPFLI